MPPHAAIAHAPGHPNRKTLGPFRTATSQGAAAASAAQVSPANIASRFAVRSAGSTGYVLRVAGEAGRYVRRVPRMLR